MSFFTDCESWTSPISTNPGSTQVGEYLVWTNAWDAFRRAPSRDGRGRRAAVDIVVRFGVRRIFSSFFFRFFFFVRTQRKRPAASMRPSCLIYLSTSNFVLAPLSYALPGGELYTTYTYIPVYVEDSSSIHCHLYSTIATSATTTSSSTSIQ